MPRSLSATSQLFAILEAERARGFEGLAGSRVETLLPLRQAALDAVLAQVRSWPAPLEALAVEIGDANRLHVTATVRVLGFRKTVQLQLRLVPALEHGLVQLVIDDGSLLGTAVSFLGPLLGRLPGGVVLEGRQLTVDVRQLAARQGLDDLAAMLSHASFQSSPGVLWITVHIEAPAPVTTARPERPAATSAPLPFDVTQMMAWLQGAHVDVDLRVNERLANELLAGMHAAAQAPSGDVLHDTLTAATRRPVVYFEAGVLRLSATAALDGSQRSDD